MADRVVPNSLNYTDIKPESIESEIKLVKFQPTATVTGAKGGDMVKFLISGNGFFDPYSSYFQFTVQVDDLADYQLKFLDRSAHSFIQRMVIRSQGVELERIENYDVIAAMINDMIYSPEQNAIHGWEGFPSQQLQTPRAMSGGFMVGYGSNIDRPDIGGAGGNFQEDYPQVQARCHIGQVLNQGSSPILHQYVGECAFVKDNTQFTNTMPVGAGGAGAVVNYPIDTPCYKDETYAAEVGIAVADIETTTYPIDFAYHYNGVRNMATRPDQSVLAANPNMFMAGSITMKFIIPIYSGVIGLLMPDKKLLPLNLLPLDIEITFNPHALYGVNEFTTRSYKITEFNMYSHVIFFEQDIHRSLEAAVAEHGIFIYCNSFHSAPQQLISNKVVPAVSYISMNLKSINSVHVVFMYNHFETKNCARKLHFVSHNLTSLQLLNGTQLIPQYAIEGEAGSSFRNYHIPFLVELMKSWNKMHDPKTDGAVQAYNYCGDSYCGQMDGMFLDANAIGNDRVASAVLGFLINKQGNVGRCQYGISLEGEELGTDKTMITGRKSQYPFLLQMKSNGKVNDHTSYMLTFLRADYIVYIRPDLQIVTLGK